MTAKKTSAAQGKSYSQQSKSPASDARTDSPDAIVLLSADHRKVEALFKEYEQGSDEAAKAKVAREIATELILHTLLEEQLFYPACREKGVDRELLDEAQVEHDGAKALIEELLRRDPEDEYFDAKVTVLSEYIRHHVAEEEKSGDGIFAKAKSSGVDLKAIGERLQARKSQLQEKAQAGAIQPPPIRSFELGVEQSEVHAMQGRYERDRDEEGRFVSSERGYRGRSRDDDDYERSGSSGRGRGWYGDPERHSEASDRGRQEREYGSRGGRYEDVDERSRGGRGEYYGSRDRDENGDYGRGGRSYSSGGGRGWSEDSERHSEASERGWDHRGGGRYESRGRDDDDHRSGGGGGGRGGHGGWFGDPEGHSRASEQRWQDRGGGRSSNRDEDENGGYRYGRGGSGRGGHGGWFGDPEGHSRAAEEGWAHRGGSSGRGR